MSSSRRRKPLVTRKILSDEEDDTNVDEDSCMTNGDTSNKEDEIPEDLPEGTVIVEPEAVEDNSFKGPEFPSSKKKVLEATGYLATVYCTACGEQINTSKKGDARRHPELSVLVCKRCYKFHTSGPIEKDEDGLDEHCRWCSEGGNLFGCDYCHNAFCQACIRRNLGRAEMSKVKDAEKFKCYVCNPAPLAPMVDQCNSVIENIEKEFEKLNEIAKKKKETEKQKSTSKSDNKDKNSSREEDNIKSKSLVVKLPGLSGKGPKTSTPKSKETPPVTVRGTVSAVKTIPSTTTHLSAPAVIVSTTSTRISAPSGMVSLIKNPPNIAPKPLNSVFRQQIQTAGSKSNIIYVEPQKGSAKQLVYVQPKSEQVSIINSLPVSQQARDPLIWTNITTRNAPVVLDQMIQSTNELLNLLRSVRVNIQGTGHFLSNIALEGRKTAISCMKSGVDLFLGQLSTIAGTNIVQEEIKSTASVPASSQPSYSGAVKLTGGNSSVSSASQKELIVLDSENDDSKMEVVDITDSSDKDSKSSSEKDKEKAATVKDCLDEKANEKEEKSNCDDNLSAEEKSELGSENKSNNSKDSNSESTTKSASGDANTVSENKQDSDKSLVNIETAEAENDAAHLELLQELQELSGTVESEDNNTEKDDTICDKSTKDEKTNDNEEDDTNSEKSTKGEKTDDKGKGDTKSEKSTKNEKKDKPGNENESEDKKKDENDDESSNESEDSESDIDESSDNSGKDSDFDVKTERSRRRVKKKEEGKNKFKELRKKRKEKERSAKKKEKEQKEKMSKDKGEKKNVKIEKTKKGSDESNVDDSLDDEIEKLEEEPVLKKSKKKLDMQDEDSKEKDDTSKGKKKERDEKVKKEKQKGDDLDDLSSTEEENAEDDENEDEEVPMEEEEDEEETEDLSIKDENNEEDIVEDSSDSEIVLTPRKKKVAKEKKKEEKKKNSEDVSGSETEEEAKPEKKRLRSSLLDAKLSDSESDFQPAKKKQTGKKRKADSSDEKSDQSTDSEQEFIPLGKKAKQKGKKNGKKKEGTGKRRKRIKKVESSDDEDDENQTEAESDELEEMKNKKKRKRKKKDEEEEEEEDEDGDESPSKGKRKDIRKLITNKKLKNETKAAAKAEEDRRARIAEKQKKYNNIIQEVDESSPTKAPITKQLILERDDKTKEPVLEVDKELVVKLKPHQVEAVEFIWNCTTESLQMLKDEAGAGCILAHCMGLGKTLSVIAFLHTMMGNYETTNISTALIVCPLNTVLNWQNEVNLWLEHNEVQLEVFELASVKMNETRAKALKEWHEDGGIMIIGYEMFRNLTQGNNCKSKKLKKIFKDTLVDPGPDYVVCDEGHILKNDASALSKAMNQIKTRRRIVLTGTPLQNNLIEYHCMVDFVKPNLLGTRKEFLNRFVNPITNGQCTDSSSHDVRLMKRRAHILHEKLAGCVQRKDYSALTKYLPPKHEYVIAVRLANVQCDLYSKYLEMGGYSGGDMIRSKGAKLFSDYQALMRIWTHPWVLKLDEIRQEMKNFFDDEDSFIDDESDTSSGSESDAKSSGGGSDSDKSLNMSDDESDDTKKKIKKKGKDEDPVKESFAGEVVKKWKTRSRGEYKDEEFTNMEEEKTPFSTGWWAEYVKEEDQFKMELSGKLMLLFEILRMCEEIGDKVLVFSQSLLSLDIIESYLEHIDKENDEALNKDKAEKDEALNKDKAENGDKEKDKDTQPDEIFGKQWLKGQDYLRMDGSTGAMQRSEMAKNFNDPDNYRLRLFLISTRAGGLGINLVAANRVIIFDASWNPSHDVQSIFRVYRFGQEKPVYVYRFLAQGTMEEKIYERQVTKQSLAQRVIDEHQIDRHFDSNDLRELYIFKPDRLDDPNRQERPTPALPKDTLLAELLTDKKEWIVGYHEHDSLLENKLDQELSEEERKAAWVEFENERKGLINTVQQRFMGMPAPGNFQQFQYGNPNMVMGMPPQLNQENLLRIVQEMKQKFPHLPQEQLTMQVQNVIRNMISRQIQQQQWEQRRQLEQREIQQQQQLQQIQARIMMQQNQLRMQQATRSTSDMSQRPPQSSSILANTLINGKPPTEPKKS